MALICTFLEHPWCGPKLKNKRPNDGIDTIIQT